jgi:hypothetical protein
MSQAKYSAKAKPIQKQLQTIVEEANQVCRFSQRRRECDASTFVQILVLGWLEKPGASLQQLAMGAEALGCKITAQGLDGRITDRAVMLLAAVLKAGLGQRQSGPPLTARVFEAFTGVYLTDSTQFKLPDRLYDEFKGNGPQQAMGKWQVTYEYLRGEVIALEWEAGRTPDQTCALPVRYAHAGSLHLFDLGYFKQERLAEIEQQGAYFVTRYQSQTALYDPETGAQLDVVRYLQTTPEDALERRCVLGRKKLLSVRVVMRRLADNVAAERRRKAKQQAKRQGKTCSRSYLTLLGWELLVTNLPASAYSPDLLFRFYSLRWQIELLFKTWKSQLQITRFGAWRPARVLCQLYAGLIAGLLCLTWTSAYRWWHERELSLTRMIQALQSFIPALRRCIARHWQDLPALVEQVEGAFVRHALKEKHKRSPSTLFTFMHWGLT